MELESRVWSAETLETGVNLVNTEVGMDSLDAKTSEELQYELRLLEAGEKNSK